MSPEPSGTNPGDELVPQKHGGALRKGGGKRKSAYKKAFEDKLKAGLPGVAEQLLKEAMKGNVQAIKLVLDHAIGKPKDTVEVVDVVAIARRVAEEEGLDADTLLAEAERLSDGDDE